MNEGYYLHLTDIGPVVAESIYERHCFFGKQLITMAACFLVFRQMQNNKSGKRFLLIPA